MDGTTEKDCSPLWSLYQQIVTDMKNSTPMWEEFISKATKLHTALKSALGAIAAFLDAFQKIADAATNARGATKEIGTALTRVCLRHRAIETKMKSFISTLMDTLITPLAERTDEWRRGNCTSGALSREHARECKRARAELRRRMQEAQRHVRKARRAPPDAKRRADVSIQDVQERKEQLEEMEERAVKAALIEERSRFCHFVTLLNPVVESEVAMLSEFSHLQEGSEQLVRHINEPRSLPPASLQVISDTKCVGDQWSPPCPSAPHSPTPSALSRKSSLTSVCSLTSLNSIRSAEQGGSNSNMGCSTPISNASSGGTIPAPNSHESPHCLSQQARIASVCSADSGFRSQDTLHRQLSLYVENGSDNQSVSSECTTPAKSCADDVSLTGDPMTNAASATWPDLKDTAQFERAASAIMAGRPHTISAGYERGHPRTALSVNTFSEQEAIYARPPLPTRCSSLERPSVPLKSVPPDMKTCKPSSLPPHLTKEMPQAVYVNMSELANLAANRSHQEHPVQEKVCSESSASESSLESSSGYGSQGAFAAEEHAHAQQLAHAEADSEIVTLRRDRDGDISIAAARESFSISLGSLEEAVRSLDEVNDCPPFATICKSKPSVPKRRPVSMAATAWSRRGSSCSLGKPPPPVRRSSSISRPQKPTYMQQNNNQQGSDNDNLPPPPAFLLQPESDMGHQGINVAETVKQLTEIKHMPASPNLVRRSMQHQTQSPTSTSSPTQSNLSTFQQAKSNLAANLNPIYGQTGQRIIAHENATFRKNSLNSSSSDLSCLYGGTVRNSPHGSTPSTPSYGDNMTSFGPRVNHEHYGTTGYKMQQDKKYGQSNTIYAQPSQIIAGFNNVAMGRHSETLSPLAMRKNIAARSQSADRRHNEQGGLIASLSAKLTPQLSPRTSRRPISTITQADPVKGLGGVGGAVQPAFLDKLSATIQQQQHRLNPSRANTVRDIINAHAQPDPRIGHTSLMEQIKRGATLKRNKHCNDRSAPKIR